MAPVPGARLDNAAVRTRAIAFIRPPLHATLLHVAALCGCKLVWPTELEPHRRVMQAPFMRIDVASTLGIRCSTGACHRAPCGRVGGSRPGLRHSVQRPPPPPLPPDVAVHTCPIADVEGWSQRAWHTAGSLLAPYVAATLDSRTRASPFAQQLPYQPNPLLQFGVGAQRSGATSCEKGGALARRLLNARPALLEGR